MAASIGTQLFGTLSAAMTIAVLLSGDSASSLFSEQRSQDSYRIRRAQMVRDQLEARGIADSATLEAVRRVPRHEFVPPARVSEAYDDNPIPIGFGQTISQPFIVGRMTELLDLKAADKVLEIGTGSGYQAAILGDIVDSVFTVEIIEELAQQAKDRLKRLGYRNIQVRNADGYSGWPDHAPFDAIIVTAAAEHIPPPLISQLKEGGRMVIPVGNPFFVQNLVLVEKRDGAIRSRTLIPVRFVPLTRSP